jgi:putative ABC transport system substrate-binding protein
LEPLSRRAVLATTAAALLHPRAASAQVPERVYRIGMLANAPRQSPQWVAFFDELGKAGFLEGKNLIADWRAPGFRPEQTAPSVAGLVQLAPDVISCGGKQNTAAVQAATQTIPILSVSDDMVAEGLIPSLAHPGGNVTGISILATELDGKRQEILMELVPTSRRTAALATPSTKGPAEIEALRGNAAMRGVELSIYPVRSPEDIAAAIDRAHTKGATALNVLASPILYNYRKIIMDRCAARRLPAIYQWPETAEEGGLAAYGPRYTKVYRQLARLGVKLLRGARPADLPVEQPTEFELVINLKTAKELDLTIPPSVLARADEVIE